MAGEKILLIDDELHIIELLKYNLETNGYKVFYALNGKEGLKLAIEKKPDLILLDIMLPEMDGFDVCKELKKNESISNIPIIMLTAKSEEFDKILGLELGADDYITKPFSVRELLARVKVVLRRNSKEEKKNVVQIHDLKLDFDKHEVLKDGKKIELTLKEFELLKLLILNKGKVLTRDFLLDKVWGYEYYGETRTVDVHVRHLRQKIEDDDKNPRYIETVRGIGYKFKE
ncbi:MULTISPECIES: winged helix-turn-helix domain-containing protein [Caloramator]|jgi:two-component system alkaline phosphatase synthesis response regulator PhoP|uniref:Stage 0 sporulation protein A homolog n=1 Tax=Caloramator australicus RC3 TaxID=857293 RepID=I7LGM8_9CLOT|nr:MULTISPECIES: response regulator transcription factor [Caloramator]MDO6354395.1 response regulator transcription factor [Caloramator sp. CAR-1]CCJ33375.1 Phosphate regulon transcriptional regulatory protein PhoB (SphR) [Caloramator australicus RC3]